MFRVAQEGLTNVARHSHCEQADLTLRSDGSRLVLTVRDYGRGLSVPDARKGQGVRGMRERAALVGGTLTLARPARGAGTELQLDLPLGSQA